MTWRDVAAIFVVLLFLGWVVFNLRTCVEKQDMSCQYKLSQCELRLSEARSLCDKK